MSKPNPIRVGERYERRFAALKERGEGAFVPFTVLGDPDPERSLDVLRALVAGGADALELGIPFSDPVADGPTIQAADVRALAAGVDVAGALDLIRRLREEDDDIPIGLLMYANLVESAAHGADLRAFYRAAADAGVDSVLVADVPSLEAAPFVAAAEAEGIAPVLIAAPNTDDEHLKTIARMSRGYTYVVTRVGVTGAEQEADLALDRLLSRLAELGAPASVLGFGISRPEHVRAAMAAGATGAIAGSAVVQRVARLADEPATLRAELERYVAEMKAATVGAQTRSENRED